MNENNSSLLRFLTELRKRVIYCLIALSLIFSVLIYFANNLYTLLALPLLRYLPVGHGLIATNVIAPFYVPFELTFFVAMFLAMPIFLYQLWAFIAPALYKKERRLIWPLLLMSTLLFYLGMVFAYFVVFPIFFHFLANTAPKGVTISPDISQYLDFTLKLFFTFGLMFEVPIVTLLLIYTGVATRQQLVAKRPYVIVGAFILGMLFAPPDVLSQTLLAIPLWLLFEIGLFLARFFTLPDSQDIGTAI